MKRSVSGSRGDHSRCGMKKTFCTSLSRVRLVSLGIRCPGPTRYLSLSRPEYVESGKERPLMNTKGLLLRAAMLGALLLGIASLSRPVRAFACVGGRFCQTATSFGRCGGLNNCVCFGND